LHEIDAWGKPTVVALNKIDRLGTAEVGLDCRASRDVGETDGQPGGLSLPTEAVLEKFQREFEHTVAISAKNVGNLDHLLDEVANQLKDRRVDVTLSIPQDRAKTIALVYRSGYVTARSMDNGHVVLKAQ